MARAPRSTLETRSARLKLAKGVRHWQKLGDNVSLAYRRPESGPGTWSVRIRVVAAANAKEPLKKIGTADDYADADATLKGATLHASPDLTVLTYFQACEKARHVAQLPASGNATVSAATDAYLERFKDEKKSYNETRSAIDAHIRPALGDRRIADLAANVKVLQKWHRDLAASPARVRRKRLETKQAHRPPAKTAEEKRSRKSSANRILTILKAILNQAAPEHFLVWRQAKPFEGADEPRIRFLTDAEGMRLVNACPADLRELVRAALLTGGRFGELTTLHVRDVALRRVMESGKEIDTGSVYFAPAKTTRGRHVPLNPEGVEFFAELLKGKTGDMLVLTKADGSKWGKNHHVRGLLEACEAAAVKPSVSFHELRHTYASHLAQAGVDLLTISKLLGHADTRTTSRHYAHLADKTLAAAVTRLPSFRPDKSTLLTEVSTRQAA